jgi:hypothetical protein
MAQIRTIWTTKKEGAAYDAGSWVGHKGELFYDPNTGEIRLSDGVTPGGILINTGGGGPGTKGYTGSFGYTGSAGYQGRDGYTGSQSYTGSQGFTGSAGKGYTGSSGAFAGRGYTGSAGYQGRDGYIGSAGYQGRDGYTGSAGIGYAGSVGRFGDSLLATPTDVIPGVPGAYDLGSTDYPWKSLYVSSSTIYVGGIPVAINTFSDLTVSGNPVVTYSTTNNLTVSGQIIPTGVTVSDTTTTVSKATVLNFAKTSGFIISDQGSGQATISLDATLVNASSFKTIQAGGFNADLVASGQDTVKFVAGQGITIETDATASPKTVTFISNSAATTAPIKTFNILNEFSAPLQPTATFIPQFRDTIRTVQLTNGFVVGMDLIVGLFFNGNAVATFILPRGSQSYTYTNLNYVINTSDYITVCVVSGNGLNFSMAFFNV